MALLSLLLNTARIKEPRAAPVQARRTIQTAGCPAKIEEPLIDGLLKAGYLDEWRYHETLSGAPQGGVLTPPTHLATSSSMSR